MTPFWGELRRRNVFKVTAAYGIVGWLLAQVADTFFPALQLPEWTVSLVAALLLLGFPVALMLAWAHELTPGGVKRTQMLPSSDGDVRPALGRTVDFVIIGLLTLALGFVLYKYVLVDDRDLTAPNANSIAVVPPLPGTQPDADEETGVLPNSIAVLPFENLSPNPDDAYFAAGMHEEILSSLGKLRNLSVISRTSVLRYADSDLSIPQIAEALNVGTVMEGSVRYANGRVRITTQLIEAATDRHLWSETYDREFSDIFAVESDIAMNIANALEAEFSEAEQERIEAVPTDSPAAYALYLRALSLLGLGVGSGPLIVQNLNGAIALDPEFAQAHALLAMRYSQPLANSTDVPIDEYERNAVTSAERALALNPSIGAAHSALANIAELHWRWADARRSAELAYELSPNDVSVLYQYQRITRSAGEYAESVRAVERLIQLEPTLAGNYLQLSITHRWARNYAAAGLAARKGIALSPAVASFHIHLAYAEAAQGKHEEALAELQLAERLFGGNFQQIFRVSQMAMAYSQIGRREDAQRMSALLEEIDRERPVGEALWAQIHLALGNYDEAYRQLEAAMARPSSANYTTLIEIKANPWSLSVLDTPRFREVLSALWSI